MRRRSERLAAMQEPFIRLSGDALPSLATEDERSPVGEEARLTEAISGPKLTKPPAMPLPRNVRGRRY